MENKVIAIKTVKATGNIFKLLEKKRLIRTFKPTKKALSTKTKEGAVDTIYIAARAYGANKLMCVGKRTVDIKFNYHPGNEDIFLLNPIKRKFKPLFIVFAFDKQNIVRNKVKKGTLAAKDLIAVKTKYNDPKTSFFTVLKNTVHCEITLPGKGGHPVFFVSEPSRLKVEKLKTNKFKFLLRKN